MTTHPEPLRIEYMRAEDLVPARKNPKAHDPALIRAGLLRFGATGELAKVDERTGRLVAGHGRRLVVIEMEAEPTKVPGGVQLDAEGRWLIPVGRGWRSRNTKEADAALIADNASSLLPGWDQGELDRMLTSLGRDALTGTGYDAGYLDRLLGTGEPPPFEPTDGSDQGRLDQRAPVTCPGCSLSFVPT